MDSPKLQNQCLQGLQKVSARCGLLPKNYWISHNSLIEFNGASSAVGKVFTTRQLLMRGNLVAVKTISPDYIENFYAFKQACLSPSSNIFSLMLFYILVHTETVYQCDHVEATTTSKRSQFPWVRLRLSSCLPRVSLDIQRELVRVLARAP